MREDEPVKVVVSNIKEFSEDMPVSNSTSPKINQVKSLKINITNLNEEQKSKLRGAIKFFSGEKYNVKLFVVDAGELKPCGALFLTEKIKAVFENIVGKENVKLD